MKRFSRILSVLLAMTMVMIVAAPALAHEAETRLNPMLKAEASVEGKVYPFIRDFGQGEYDESEVTL